MESVFTVEYSDDSGAASSVEVVAASKYAAKRAVKRANPGVVINRVCGGSSDSPTEDCHADGDV